MSYIQSSMDRYVQRSSSSDRSGQPLPNPNQPPNQPGDSSGFFSESLQQSWSFRSDFSAAGEISSGRSRSGAGQPPTKSASKVRIGLMSSYKSVNDLSSSTIGGAPSSHLKPTHQYPLKRSYSVASHLNSTTTTSSNAFPNKPKPKGEQPTDTAQQKIVATAHPKAPPPPPQPPSSQPQLLTGTVRHTIHWHRQLPQLPALCEIFARVLRIVGGSATSDAADATKLPSTMRSVVLLLCDDHDGGRPASISKPQVLPVHYYAIDRPLPADVRAGAAVRCVGRFTAPLGRFQAYKCRLVADGVAEGALVARLAVLSNYGLTEAKRVA